MALLRLLSSPSHLHLSTAQFSSISPNFSPLHKCISPIQPPCTISLHIPSLSPLLPIKPQRPYLYTFHCSIQTPETQQEQSEEGSGARVLAQNVPWTSTADDLRPLFEKFGTVVDIEIAMYNKTRSRGLVFVTMGSHDEAKAVLENLEAYELEGRPLRLAWANPKANKPSSPPKFKPQPIHNLFVANLHFEARSKDLLEFFKDNGANAVSAEVIFNDNPRRSAGYGFVTFNTKGEAEAALSSFQGKELMGRPLRVAASRRFLRAETKKNVESQELQSELVSVAE